MKLKVLIPVMVLVLALGVGAGLFFSSRNKEEKKEESGYIPMAENVVLVGGGNVEPPPQDMINLKYNYQAFSKDGINFTGLLANDPGNEYDMFVDIFADAGATDRIYLSGLLPPGTGLQSIELNRALPVGTNTVYVAFNQVDFDENGEQAIVGQAVVTVEFIVTEE